MDTPRPQLPDFQLVILQLAFGKKVAAIRRAEESK